jgi:hypothetical protein
MLQLEYDLYQAVGIVCASFILYIVFHYRDKRKELKLGLLIFAYIRDINTLLTHKLLNEWINLSIPQKLDMLKSIYDVILSYDDILKGDKTDDSKPEDLFVHNVLSDNVTAFDNSTYNSTVTGRLVTKGD